MMNLQFNLYELMRSSIASADNTVTRKKARLAKADASSSSRLVKQEEAQETLSQFCSAFLDGEIVELDPADVVKEELEETVVACPGFAFLAQCVRKE